MRSPCKEPLTEENKSMPPEVATFLLGMTPIIELRGAIPIGTRLGLPIFESFFYATAGNIITVLPVIFLLERVRKHLTTKYQWWRNFFEKLNKKIHAGQAANFEKYGPLALILFVSIPLPGTGGWTGALAASIFEIPPQKAWKLITLGIIIAGTIMSIGWESTGAIVSYMLFKVNLLGN